MRDADDDFRIAIVLSKEPKLWCWQGRAGHWPDVRAAIEFNRGEYFAVRGEKCPEYGWPAAMLAFTTVPTSANPPETAGEFDPMVAAYVWLGYTRVVPEVRVEKSERWERLLDQLRSLPGGGLADGQRF
jgi:hypothetical protein